MTRHFGPRLWACCKGITSTRLFRNPTTSAGMLTPLWGLWIMHMLPTVQPGFADSTMCPTTCVTRPSRRSGTKRSSGAWYVPKEL